MTTPVEQLRLKACLRVSTKGQVDAYGFPAQRKDVKRWAKLNRVRLPDSHIVEEKAVSGTEDERPELTKLLLELAAGEIDGILFPNMDRVARELTIQEATLSVIWAYGGRAFTADGGEVEKDDPSDPMRTFVRQVMGAASQLERGLITKRLRGGKIAKLAKGGYAHGSPEYGTITDHKGNKLEDLEELETLAYMEKWKREGASYREICANLEAKKILTKQGKEKWQPATVARMLNPEQRKANKERNARAREFKKEQHQREKATRVLGKVRG